MKVGRLQQSSYEGNKALFTAVSIFMAKTLLSGIV